MKQLMELVITYQKNKSEKVLEEIFELIEPLMKKYAYKVKESYQEDMMQEMKMKTYETLCTFQVISKPFCQNQLLGLLEMKFKYVIAKFYRTYGEVLKRERSMEKVESYLTSFDPPVIELKEILSNKNVSSSEIQFLDKFIVDGKLLTQAEVAKELGISQQKVSRLWNSVKRKYKTPYKQP